MLYISQLHIHRQQLILIDPMRQSAGDNLISTKKRKINGQLPKYGDFVISKG